MSEPAAPGKTAKPENLLFRSRLEISRILQTLGQMHSTISADISGHPFSSRLLAVDAGTGRFVVAYSGHKVINAMLMKSPKVEFTVTDQQGLHYSFEAANPEETLIEGEHAIQFAFPKALAMHNRREYPRYAVPAEVSLRCVADEGGFIPFESHINDISHDGLGCLIYDSDINLEAGTILHGCRIVLPNGDAVVTDLELRYAARITLPDGSLANSAGFRFIQQSNDLAKVIKQFIQDLDKK
jgi:c-di-GMP-binding flagellar brake protein YcgR